MWNFIFNYTPVFYLTQSLWRDEAFSILTAEHSLGFIFTKLSFEPPVYYILLHFWIRIFGESEVAARSLSLLGLLLAAIIIVYWSEQIFKKSWLSWFLPVFFFTNPMLLYYGFEIRTYGWYIFFAVLSMYAYLNRKWKLYLFAAVAGFYTHTYFLFTIFVQALHYTVQLLIKAGIFPALVSVKSGRTKSKLTAVKIDSVKKIIKLNRLSRNIFAFFKKDQGARSFLISFILIFPWLVKVALDSVKLKSSWYFPVDWHLVKSVLGNMYIGYEGTPWYLWDATAKLSLILIAVFIYAIIKSKNKLKWYFLLNIFIPLVIVIGVSFFKPLYVNRYLIPVTISEVFMIAFALEAIKNKKIQILLGLGVLLTGFWFNSWYPTKHAKFPYRDTMQIVNAIRKPNDLIYATSSVNFFETLYYSHNRKGVYLYNPTGAPFPWYVGDAIVTDSQMTANLPEYPSRAILVTPDGKIQISYKTE